MSTSAKSRMRHRPLGIPGLLLAAALAMPGCKPCGDAPAPPTPPDDSPDAAASEAPSARPRVVVLGFDGVDPDLLARWMKAGELPNLQKLAAEGHFSALGSTTPPQSPVAWATFATGRQPGDHGIYDFIARSAKNYMPRVATVRIRRPEVKSGALEHGLSGENLRRGPSFWRLAGEAGVRGSVLFVPYSYPPDGTREMRVISGLGTPDLRGTNSTFQYFAEEHFPGEGKAGPVSGGSFAAGRPDSGGWQLSLNGPSIVRDGKSASLSLDARVDRTESGLSVTAAGATHAVRRGDWSETVTLSFEPVPGTAWSAVSRWYAVDGRRDPLALYLAPLSPDPRDPPFPISTPPGFSARLAEAAGGPFKTVGWIHETSGLSTEALDEAGFLSDAKATMTLREQLLLHVLAEGHDDLTIAAFTATDRVAHMFWRLIDEEHPRHDSELAGRHQDAILDTYREMDRIVGRVREVLPPDAALFLVSDHGFHSFRRGVNLNRWLVKNGYMTLKPGITAGRDFFRDVDWSKTRAYAVGTGQIWLNLAGREDQGVVSEVDAPALAREIAEGLATVRDGGTPVVARVHLRESVYSGAAASEAPDLTVSFHGGYRTAWGSILGGSPLPLIEDNDKKWSGDHAASDPEDTQGFVMSNRKLAEESPSIEDVASTVLSIYGVENDLPGGRWVP